MTSDRGSQFVSDLWLEVCSLMGITRDPTTSYHSGAGTIFQQGGQDQPFPAGVWGRCKAPAGSGAEPLRQADFDNNLLKIN